MIMASILVPDVYVWPRFFSVMLSYGRKGPRILTEMFFEGSEKLAVSKLSLWNQ
jgi:hypothetical protein